MVQRYCDKCKVEIRLPHEDRKIFIGEENNKFWVDLCFTCEKAFKEILSEFMKNDKPQTNPS